MAHLRKFLTLLMVTGIALAIWPPQLIAQGDNQAALVVRFGDGNVQTRCVSFSESQITGYDLLVRSGLDVVADVQGMGALVCGIGGTGCPANNCLCQCSGADCVYWSYWLQNGGAWQYSAGGSGMVPVTHGAVQGWSWGPGSVSAAVPPPVTSFEAVCQVPPTATLEPTPTLTAVPPTLTAVPPTPTSAPEISFSVDTATIPAGGCTHLRWQVNNITAVYLNGGGVTGEEVRQVCPAQSETYTLRVVYGGGEETRSLTVTVLAASPTATATAVTADVILATAVPPTSSATPGAVIVPGLDVTATATMTDAVTAVTDVAPTAAAPTHVTPTDDAPVIIWVTVPPLLTATATPTAAVIAALPPDASGAASNSAAPDAAKEPVANDSLPGVTTAAVTTWMPYAVFLIIVMSISLLIARAEWQNGRL